MKLRILAATAAMVATAAFAMPAAADCAYPKSPSAIPDGATATEAEMLAGMTEFKRYDAEINAYLACLDKQTQARVSETSEPEQANQIKAVSTKRHNAAIDELQAHADEFNAQLKAYKSKAKPKG
jgi:hypothetical protein